MEMLNCLFKSKSLVTEVKKIGKSIKYLTQIENNKAFATRVTQRVALVELELLTVLKHTSSPQSLWGSCCSIHFFV